MTFISADNLSAHIVNQTLDLSHIRKTLLQGRKIVPAPYAVWRQFSWLEILQFLYETATYVAPTEELLDFLDELIGDEKTIEICAGNGSIGSELDIVMTDSYQQRDDKFTREHYQKTGQPLIQYPGNVLKLEASAAVRRMKPHTVIGCYAMHKWREDTKSGNYKGVDFEDVYAHCSRLVLVSHLQTHKDNPLMSLPHQEIELPGLLTRAADQSQNRIFIWEH